LLLGRLAAAPPVRCLGGWLLPSWFAVWAAGCCPSGSLSGRLAAAPLVRCLGGWLLPLWFAVWAAVYRHD